jgi:tetratricopeptide (TPR) repeat protein
MLNSDDQPDDIGQSADDPLSESLMLDLSGSGAVKAADLEFDQLIRENQLEESDVAAPGLEVLPPLESSGMNEWYTYGVDHIRRRKWHVASEAFERALSADVGRNAVRSARAMACLGYALMKSGRAQESIAQYRGAIDIVPDMAGAHTGLAAAMLRVGDQAAAIKALAAAIRVVKNSVGLNFNYGNLLAAAGQPEEAKAAFFAALAQDEHHVPSLTNLGALHAKHDRLDDALDAFSRAYAAAPRRARRARYNMSLVLGRLKQWDEAMQTLRALMEEHPDATRPRILAARILRCAGRYLEAIEVLDNYMEWPSRMAPACEMLGLVHHDLGNADQAMAFWHEALRADPRFVRVHVHIARAHLHAGAVLEAEVAIRAAVELRPERAASWTVSGQIDFAQGRFDQAIGSLERAVELNPADAEAQYWLGRSHLSNGSMIGAIRQCEQLESISPQHAARLRARVY